MIGGKCSEHAACATAEVKADVKLLAQLIFCAALSWSLVITAAQLTKLQKPESGVQSEYTDEVNIPHECPAMIYGRNAAWRLACLPINPPCCWLLSVFSLLYTSRAKLWTNLHPTLHNLRVHLGSPVSAGADLHSPQQAVPIPRPGHTGPPTSWDRDRNSRQLHVQYQSRVRLLSPTIALQQRSPYFQL
jgi:hypothetical protein